jgi:hypothetical protein
LYSETKFWRLLAAPLGFSGEELDNCIINSTLHIPAEESLFTTGVWSGLTASLTCFARSDLDRYDVFFKRAISPVDDSHLLYNLAYHLRSSDIIVVLPACFAKKTESISFKLAGFD